MKPFVLYFVCSTSVVFGKHLAKLLIVLGGSCSGLFVTGLQAEDFVAELQKKAIADRMAPWGYWGPKPDSYNGWTNHSNRLIPVYVYGASFQQYMKEGSIYRDPERLKALYQRTPESTFNPDADYADQTDIFRLQKQVIQNGKKNVILIVFDGMDWQTTWMAANYASKRVAYTEGRGTGLTMQDYRGVETDYGYVVTSPHDDGEEPDVDRQCLKDEPVDKFGGYNWRLAGSFPWSRAVDVEYPIGRSRVCPHSYTDSSSSATSLTAGVKTFNGSVNVMPNLDKVETIAHWAQREKRMSVGAVTSVPISHATPAASYAHNVSRDDFQDLTRDLIGLPSIAHPTTPLSGLDVLIGSGWGEQAKEPGGQGANFIPGNRYLTAEDVEEIQTREDRRYTFVQRTMDRHGAEVLREATQVAIKSKTRLLGFFGVANGHLPFQTADGDYKPVEDIRDAEKYSKKDLNENPLLGDMAEAALEILSQNDNGFWLMIEAGDVDWANHANNVDNSIGAVLSGDRAVKRVFDWVESKKSWGDTVVIITADHGHYLNIVQPEALCTTP